MITSLYLLGTVFIVSFFFNLLWEVLHSTLYRTCWEMPFGKVQRLLVIMSLKDGFWIVSFYALASFITGVFVPYANTIQMGIFFILCLTFSFIDELLAIKWQRWEYSDNMPRFLGVGLTPFLELAITGGAALYVAALLPF
ncbi:MAG: hypothetical protein KGZ30_02085 [Anaplasmataceae bacterium]|nr:hypothetical protein [Anaplasmataceae bacterium]